MKTILSRFFLMTIMLGANLAHAAGWYSANMPYGMHNPAQSAVCYCAPAGAQGIIQGLTGGMPAQSTIAYTMDPTGSACVTGMNASEVTNGLNVFAGVAGGYSRSFVWFEASSWSVAKSRLLERIKSGKPVMLATSTVNSDGSIRNGGHWLVVYAAYEDANGNLTNVKVHDPLYNSSWASNYIVVPWNYTLPTDTTTSLVSLAKRWQKLTATSTWQYVTYY